MVLYYLYHEAVVPLVPRPIPADLLSAGYATFPVTPVVFAAEMTLSDLQEQATGLAEQELTETQQEAYWALQHRHGDGTSRLLGNPDTLQNPMRAQCALVTRGLHTGNQKLWLATQQALEVSAEQVATWQQQAPAEWELLLQLDSHNKADMLWGERGRLYFWIPRAALARRDFSAVWQVLQCT